ncbi:MAG: hypothetical protein WA687_08835 [Solirubrobacterales bacterium]
MRRFSTVRTVLYAAGVAMLSASFTATAMADSCPRTANQPTTQEAKKTKGKEKKEGSESAKTITLKPETASEVVNFGGTRGTKSVDVVLLASQSLPDTFSPKQLELDSPKRFQRAGQALDSASLPLPRFSNPQLIEHRKKILLRICLDADGAKPGTYSGTIYISGPRGIGSTSVALTTNLKTSGSFFLLVQILAIFLAFFLLLLKAAKEEYDRLKKGQEGEDKGGKAAGAKAKTSTKKAKPIKWREAILPNLTDLGFWASTLIALGAAFVAMRAIYDSTPAWGTETWTNVFALFGTAFGAAGIGSLLTTFTHRSTTPTQQG